MRILAGDIGGTKTVLALYERSPTGEYATLARGLYPSAHYASLEAVLGDFLGERAAALDAASFALAGPVADGMCTTTNLPWLVSANVLSAELHTKVELLNDFHAVALGVPELAPSDLRVLQEGRAESGQPFAVIGAGTGLGEAIGVPTSSGLQILPTEGGHCDFAPRSEVEIRLLRFLLQRHSRVSVERVVSGLGLLALYDFVVADGLAPDDPQTRARCKHESAGAVIGERAGSGEDPAAEQALLLFASLYGAEAGNFALKVLPKGGLYIAGGIAAKLDPRLLEGPFVASFLAKGRMSKILETIRVAVVHNPDVGLLGARAHAALH